MISTKKVGRLNQGPVVWMSLVVVMAVLASVGAYSLNADAREPALFNKLGPASGLSGLGSNVQMTWGRLAGAVDYYVCVDNTNNNKCDTSWRPEAQATVLTLENLKPGTYYWQVRARVNGSFTEADDGQWWSFTVGGGSAGKLAPAPGTSGLGSNVKLTWARMTGADYYEFCVDTTNNNRCDTPWRPEAQATVLTLDNLKSGTYYWQVRALVSGRLVELDAGRWWSFTVR
jgi:hypothetical protein